MDKVTLLKLYRDYLDSKKHKYFYDPENLQMRLKFEADCGFVISIWVMFNDNRITARADCDRKADPENYSRVVEYLTRANYGLPTGNFEFDYRDGEITFKFVNFLTSESTDELTEKCFSKTISTPMHWWDQYGEGFKKMLDGLSTPEEEIEKAEAPSTEAAPSQA